MKSITPNNLPPFIFSTQNKAEQVLIRSLKKQGLLRKIGPRLYTTLPPSEVQKAVRGNWAQIVAALFPDTLLSHRSAFEYIPTEKNQIFLTSTTNREIVYPGLILKFLRGPKILEDDLPMLSFKVSSLPRALLENLSGKSSKNLSQEELEKKLEAVLHAKGEAELNLIRDRAKVIAKKFLWQIAFKKLDKIIGALLGTRDSQSLKTSFAQSRALGKPYDTECVERLEKLFGTLRTYSLPTLKETFRSALHLKNKSFFDTYFSNYIEGTTFEVSEAEEIIFQKNLPKSRPKDAHDILENFLLVSDLNEMKKIPTTFDRFLNLVKERHHFILSKRPEASPGQFKQKPNRAGSTQFVTPEYVMGTLEKGFEFYLNLPSGIARAIYMMFLIADVHPFVDGNGRIARIMMNAELVSQGLVTIIIPTVYREDYLLTLRALSRNHRSEPLVRMLVKAQQFSNLDFASYPKTLKYLEDHHWFEEADDGKIIL